MGRISSQKRQKEMKRQEKQRMKADKRAQRKLNKTTGGPEIAPFEESFGEDLPELDQGEVDGDVVTQ